jgi:hypothetical protein
MDCVGKGHPRQVRVAQTARDALREIGRFDLVGHVAVVSFGSAEPVVCCFSPVTLGEEDSAIVMKAIRVANGVPRKDDD